MPPLTRAPFFDADREGEYHRTIGAIPGLARRLEGCARVRAVIGATDLSSYFRHSSVPGWALAGDAGHALYRHFAQPEHAHQLLDLHSRILRPSEVLAPFLAG